MRRHLSLLAALLLAPVAASADMPAVGQIHEAHVTVADKQVPLPAGRWRVAGVGHTKLADDKIIKGAYGSILNVVLLREGGGDKVSAFVEINVNALPLSEGWGIARNCERQDLHLSVVTHRTGWDVACYFVSHARSAEAEQASPAWRQAAAAARAAGRSLPGNWIAVGFRAGNRQNVVDSRYGFNPEVAGFNADANGPWAEDAWAAGKIQDDKPRMDFLFSVVRWAADFHPLVDSGLRNRLGDEPPMRMPSVVKLAGLGSASGTEMAFGDASLTDGEAPSPADTKMATLERLYADKLISREKYEAQRAELMSYNVPYRPIPPSSETVALWKTLAYRPMVSTANVFIDTFWIGAPFAAGVLVFLQVTVNTTKFYFHELAWDKVFGGGKKRADAPTIDFVYGTVAE
jgi:uncharacterized membrane protein